MSKGNWIVLGIFIGSMVSFMLCIVALDVWLSINFTTTYSISWSMALLRKYPFFVFMIGLTSGGILIGLAAHFFANQDTPDDWDELLKLRKENAIMRAKLHIGPNDPVV